MLELFAMLRGGVAAEAGEGPTGPPVGPNDEVYSSPEKFRIHWINGDSSAYTRIYQNSVSPGNLLGTENPGMTSFDSALLVSGQPYTVLLTHFKNAQESSSVSFTVEEGEE